MNTPTKIVVHHTNGVLANSAADTSHHTAQIIDEWHRTQWGDFVSKVYKNDRGVPYACGYHVVIEADGKIVHTRGYSERGAHCIGMNGSSIGVCVVGNFDSGYPTKMQQSAFIELWKEIKRIYPHLTPHDIVPHRKYSTKSCFGDNLTDDYFAGIVLGSLKQTDREKEIQQRKERAKMLELIEVLQTFIAIFTQKLTDKRMKL